MVRGEPPGDGVSARSTGGWRHATSEDAQSNVSVTIRYAFYQNLFHGLTVVGGGPEVDSTRWSSIVLHLGPASSQIDGVADTLPLFD